MKDGIKIMRNLYYNLEHYLFLKKSGRALEENKDLLGEDLKLKNSYKMFGMMEEYFLFKLTSYSLIEAGKLSKDEKVVELGELILEKNR